MVRLTVSGRRGRGDGVSPSALTVRKCETFDPLKGLKTVFFDKKKHLFFANKIAIS